MDLNAPQPSPGTSISLGLALVLVLFFLAGLSASQDPLPQLAPSQEGLSTLAPPGAQEADLSGQKSDLSDQSGQTLLEVPQPIPGADAQIPVTLLRTSGQVLELTLEDYLWGVVSAEMPATFPLEALKAQAVAARTYTASRLLSGTRHPTGQLCDDSGCCQAYYSREERMALWGEGAPDYAQTVEEAVGQTDGLYVLYEEAPIDAVFFSSASGQTLDAQAVWGGSLPYLVGVDSPEGDQVPNYHTQVVLSQEELRNLLINRYPQADLSGDPSLWFQDWQYHNPQAVAQVQLGGVTLTGDQLRSLFSLRSTAFTLEYQEESFVFSVTGYGHGVGMSQYGAKTMAEEGQDFHHILCWYYSNTQIAPFSW